MSRFRAASAASPALVAVALAAIAFGAGGGTQTGRAAPVEAIVILVAGGLLAAALPSFDTRRPLYGGAAIGLLTLLTVLTGLSMTWSVAPDLSLQELARTFTYLSVFVVAVLAARRLPARGGALLNGVLLAAVAVCLWALATRVWPGSLGGDVLGARLGEPFDYWNALGGMAALAVPGALWVGSRRDASRPAAALAYPALGALLLTIMLTQSRGALAAAVLAALIWLAFVPLRLRTAPVLAVAAVGVAPVSAWALSQEAFTAALQPLAVREDVAGTFGLLTAFTLIALTIAGFSAVSIRATMKPSLQTRRRAGIGLAACLAVVAVVGLVGIGASGGGIGKRIDDLTTSQSSAPGSGAERLGSVSSSRGEYWRQAIDVWKDRPLLGRGADGFTLARLEYREDPRAASHAHGFLPQTMADLGLAGLLVALALLAAWLVATARTLGVRLRNGRIGPDWTSERLTLTGLALTAVAYGIQSAIDWTWFIPGPTVAALAAAGFVAGRGPLPPVGESEGPAPAPAREPRRDPLRLALAVGVVITALLCAWTVWQPERSQRATDEAVALAERGDTEAALEEAARARDIDPYSPDPLYARATALTDAGQLVAAYRVLEQAVAEHPRNPETWLRLAQFELDELGLGLRAVRSAQAAATIDPASTRVAELVQTTRGIYNRQAQAAARAQEVLRIQRLREQGKLP
ncbi:MAG TPA: tetratricopeptide repeat protein [Thermoleophilaceae bacterium]|nr:tetratricopeptide repeat protein [Thermoleophilaceae bacterium]